MKWGVFWIPHFFYVLLLGVNFDYLRVFIRNCSFLLGLKETSQRKEPPPRSPLKGGTNHSPTLVHTLRMTGIHKPVRTVVACAIALSNIFMARPAPSHHCSFYSFTSHIKATNVEYLIYWQHWFITIHYKELFATVPSHHSNKSSQATKSCNAQ
jgi:hypothetical protein